MYASIVFKVSRDKTGFHKLHVDVLGKLLAALGSVGTIPRDGTGSGTGRDGFFQRDF